MCSAQPKGNIMKPLSETTIQNRQATLQHARDNGIPFTIWDETELVEVLSDYHAVNHDGRLAILPPDPEKSPSGWGFAGYYSDWEDIVTAYAARPAGLIFGLTYHAPGPFLGLYTKS